ncbi:DUF4349 domain-containing protein [Mycobacterium asiaticum]|uniref:DUF4349 domain-containing protein n=1 Tax=Mycobacterium asiaticum TaxID=1790 RepID=UPI000565F978|nr:DUF4349 domain-containing protein [Mycobacterium asiaticum]ORA16146.1 hypothetical protein BST16_07485 [Mycobacterium asiaticum DSM 44297]
MTVRITWPTDAASATDGHLGALRTERGNLPLDRIDIRVDVTGLTAQVELTQDFVNTFDVPLEASYVFPLPDQSAVTDLRLTLDGRIVPAGLKEREEARRGYDTSVTAGRRASITEEERPDVFTIRVGNIKPGERVSAAITLAIPLSCEDGEATFRFPLVVAPRYIPGEPLADAAVGDGHAADTDAVPDASRITPPVLLPGFPRRIPLSIDIGIDSAELSDVTSNLPTETTDDGRLKVLTGARADRDLVLRMPYAAKDSLLLVPDAAGDEGTYLLTVQPPVSNPTALPRNLVLLLDCSDSMSGWKMAAARRAAARIVDSLTAADRFTVLTFADRIDRPAGLPDGLVAANDRNRFRAVEHLTRVEAEGDTGLFAPLQEALTLLRDAKDATVVLISDGQVGNEDQILRGLTADLQRVRLHAVGIDQAANAGFLRRLATVGGGHCDLVESEDRLDEALQAMQRRIDAPLVRALSLHSDGLSLLDDTASPARLPDLLPGVPLVVAGRYRGSADGSLTVRGVDRDGADWSVMVVGQRASVPTIRALWARAHLRDLEDRHASSQDRAARIVETSLRFGVLSRFTAYVAADDRIVATGELQHRVMQPVEIPAGWTLDAKNIGAKYPEPKPPRTVKLRNVIAVVVAGAVLLGGGGIWSLSRDGSSPATRDGVAAGKLTESPNQYRPEPSSGLPATLGGGIADNTTVAPAPLAPPTDTTMKRDIVTNGSLQLVVAEPGPVADRLITAVTDAGGRVDSRTERSGSSSPVVSLMLRIPADKLDAVLADAKKLGSVQSMSINHTDVTTQRVDLDARIDALQTSVKRLLELMSKAGNVADLLSAESQLTQRQAELDSLKAQRFTLGDEISYATITVNISTESKETPQGFSGALERGWHSLLGAAHAGLLLIGFLLPWLVLLSVPVFVLVLWLRRKAAKGAAKAKA